MSLKRKAVNELAREGPVPSSLQPFIETQPMHPTLSSNDDVESQSASSSEAHSTPVTTAHSTTASRRFPSDLKTILCTWPGCTKSFNRPARLTAHLRSHNNDRPFKCTDCSKTYMEEKHLRQHIKGSHTQERQYICAECKKAFLTATRLRRHAVVHEGQDRFRCRGYENCARTFRKHQTLQRHIRVDHLGQPAFACKSTEKGETCRAVFVSAGALRRHVEREHGVPKFWCDECSAASNDDNKHSNAIGFATKALLEAHMRREHVSCLFCDVRCTGQAQLQRHIDVYHSGKTVEDRKTIICPHEGCGRMFTRRPNLNVHIRQVHEGLRFVCGQSDDAVSYEEDAIAATLDMDPELASWNAQTQGCGSRFVSKMKLKEHILYVHLRRERPVVAPNSAAIGEDVLDALTGSRYTLACSHSECTARFARHHDLRLHQRKMHAVGGALSPAVPPTIAVGDTDVTPPDNFWIGAGHDNGTGRDVDDFQFLLDMPLSGPFSMDDAQWQIDEEEMRQLIGDGHSGNNNANTTDCIDPKLFT